MYIPLDRDCSQPLLRQISSYLEELIRRGHLGPSAPLPATRTLARSLGVSKNTVETAYEELAARRLVRIRRGKGATVRRDIPDDLELDLPFRPRRTRDPLPADAYLPAARVEGTLYDFTSHAQRRPTVSPRALRSFHTAALADSRAPLFSPPPPLGEAALRAAACRHLARDGVLRSPEEVAILPSRREAVRRVLRLFVPRKGSVVATSLLDPDLAIPLREHGVRVVVLPPEDERLPRVKPRLVLAVTGRSRLPGAAPGIARRRALLDLARERRIPILEDVTSVGPLTGEPAPPPLSVLDSTGRVLPMADLSDEVGGAFDGCVLAASPRVLERLRVERAPGPPAADRLSQRVLAGALDAPGRSRARRRVTEERRLLTDSIARGIQRRLGELAGHEFTTAGDAVRLDLPPGIAGAQLAAAANARGVRIWSARDCGAAPARDRFVLLDLTRHEEGELRDGIRLLGEALDDVPDGGSG